MSARNAASFFLAAPPMSGAASAGLERVVDARLLFVGQRDQMRSIVVVPMPRAGTLMMRRRSTSSCGLVSTRRYESRSLTSARSKNLVPPTIWYGMFSARITSSSTRDWAWTR